MANPGDGFAVEVGLGESFEYYSTVSGGVA